MKCELCIWPVAGGSHKMCWRDSARTMQQQKPFSRSAGQPQAVLKNGCMKADLGGEGWAERCRQEAHDWGAGNGTEPMGSENRR